jgi:acyl-CoA reductase-like NAD-dependent aldehyde dehydrogenase
MPRAAIDTLNAERKGWMKDHLMYIGGEWVGAQSGKTFEDVNPYQGIPMARVAAGGRSDAKRAVEAAQQAFPGWSSTMPQERRALLLRAADLLEERRNDFVSMLIKETGSTFGFAMFQSFYSPGILREAASQVHELTGDVLPANMPGAFYFSRRQPLGVVAGIAPWNAPLILSLRAVSLPLACGNTVVLKPAPDSPISGGIMLAELFEAAGFPKGVVNVVTHDVEANREIGDEFVENRAVRCISFTGSTAVGRELAEKCGRYLKRIALELGGHNPLIVLSDADIEHAVKVAAFGAFLHQGQICMSVRRIIVERSIAAEFTDKLVAKAQSLKVGDPEQHDTVIGPLINQKQLEHVKNNVGASVAAGANILCGGKHEGLCYYPTVLSNVTPAMRVSCEETFGPVVSILPVGGMEEALRVANDSNYGLSAGVLTRDYEKGLWLAERLETGMVHINDSTVLDEPQVPFGGMKDSGLGRMGGRAARDEFTELRWISLQREPRHYPI